MTSLADAPSVPAHVPAHLVRDVDVVNDPDVLADPYAAFDRLRGQGKILWSTALGGHWIVLGADEVREVFNRPDDFSSYPTGVPPMVGFWPRKLIPQELDGAEHRRFRRLLSPFFSPAAVRPLAEAVRRRANALIDRFAEADGCEFVTALARPLPAAVYLDLFGAPAGQADTFTEWVDVMLRSADPQRRAAAGGQIIGYLLGLIEARRAEPRDDLISRLIAASADEGGLTDEDLLDTAFLLFIAGMDTVSNQLGIVFHHLARHPELQEVLRAEPERIPAAVEELLRVYPIVPPARTAARDTVLGGVEFRRGDTILVAVSGASRDPALLPDAGRVDLSRTGGGLNTAFGLGPHRCLGAHLARQELRIVLELMTTRVPVFELAAGAAPRWHTAGNVWGVDQLPITFRRPS